MRTALVEVDRVVAINHRLRRLVRLVFVASTLVVAALFGYWIVEQSRALRAEIERDLAQHARFSAEHVRLAFSNVEKQSRILIRVVEQRPPGPGFDEAAIHRLAKILADESPEIRALWVVDYNGHVVADSAGSPPPVTDVSDRPYFTHQQSADVPQSRRFIGTPMKSRVSDLWAIHLSLPIQAADGSFAGVVAASVDPAYFSAVYDRAQSSTEVALSLINRDGDVVYIHPFDETKLSRPLAPSGPATDAHLLAARASTLDGDFVVIVTSPATRLGTLLWRGIFWNGAVGAVGAGLVLFLWLMSERAIRVALEAGELAAQRLQSLSQAHNERDALYDQIRGALDALPASFIIVDRDDRLVLWNKAFEHVTGTPPGFIRRGMAYREILETAIRLRLIPEANGDAQDWIDSRIAARRRPGGTVAEGRRQGRWFLFTDFPTPDGGVVGLRYDITDLKAAIARAEQAELLLNDALDSMSDAVLLLDPDDRLIGFNQTVTRTFPHPEDFRIGDTIAEIARRRVARGLTPYTDRHLEDLRASRHRLRYGDPPFTFEHRRSDGRWILTRQRRMASGGFISLITDVTELREAQYLAVRAETVLREAINAMTDGWLLWNAEDRLTMFNAPAERLLLGIVAIDNGMGAAAFVGALQPLLADDRSTREAAARTVADLLAERRSPHGLRCEYRTADGRWLSLREQPTRTGWTVSILSDVTYHHRVREEIDRAREAAERSNEAKSRFLATASHDLRQPVHAVTLLVDALGRRVQNDDERRIVGAVSESLRSIREMFNTLLYVSRLDSGKLEAAPMPVRIGDLLDRLAAETRPTAAQAGLRLRVVPSRAVVVRNPVLLESILRNFVGNAVKFTQAGGVLVGCRRRGARVRVEIWDTGPGIPADAIESVFEDFKRLPDPTGRPTEGMGLGLSIVRRIADMLGCDVTVRSWPGRGSCFAVELPAATLDMHAADASPTEAIDIAGARILVVDDDEVIVAALSTALQARGARVEGFSSTADALAWAEGVEDPPDYLLVDLQLGGELNGIDLVHRLTARFGRELVAVVLTGSTSAEAADLLADDDMVWLAKPVDTDMIVEALGRARRRLATTPS